MKKNTKPTLVQKNPKLAREWHPTKNALLTPKDVTAGSSKKVWWICRQGHEWIASVSNRNMGKGCPYCAGKKTSNDNCLQRVNPRVAKEWHPMKNAGLAPRDVTPGSGKKVWWLCKKGHEWQSKIHHRSRGAGCPYCAGQKASKENSLQTVNPGLSKEWHPTKNAPLTPRDVKCGSNKKVWWLCGKGHEWETSIGHRKYGQGCPYCAGRKVCRENCLQTLYPALAREWHPAKNAPLTPRDVTPGSEKRVWWTCKKGHEWIDSVLHRRHGRNCPYCSGHRATKENSIAAVRPRLAKEWHPTKNAWWTPKEIAPHSEKQMWWKCKEGHELREPVVSRYQRGGCPVCTLRARVPRLFGRAQSRD